MALGGRWGRSEEESAEPEEGEDFITDSESAAEAVESEVVEASEVITESDPWE